MIIPMQYTHFGYDFLDSVSSGGFHSGIDLNFGAGADDLGMEVKVCGAGTVVFSENTGGGWGNLVVVHHPEQGVWSRYGHLQDRLVDVGDVVEEGTVIGHVGNSGGNWSPHLHWDIILRDLASWREYTEGMSRDEVREVYAHPIEFVEQWNRENGGDGGGRRREGGDDGGSDLGQRNDNNGEIDMSIPGMERVTSWARKEMTAAVRAGAVKEIGNPQVVVGDATFEQILFNLGVVKQVWGNLSKERLVVALYRLGKQKGGFEVEG